MWTGTHVMLVNIVSRGAANVKQKIDWLVMRYTIPHNLEFLARLHRKLIMAEFFMLPLYTFRLDLSSGKYLSRET